MYSSTIRRLTRNGRFPETSIASILHSSSIPIPQTERSLPPKFCSIGKLLSTNKWDFFIQNNGQKVNYTTDADRVNSTTDDKNMPSCNIVKLLSTDTRDFLIRNNGQKVKIDSLNGKFVVVLYMQYPTHLNAPLPLGLLEAYKALYAKGDFEVVFVTFTENDDDKDSHKWFNKNFLKMPWLTVPFSDYGARKCVRDALFMWVRSYASQYRIIDKFGKFLCEGIHNWFDIHGANWYPFTKQRLDELCKEAEAVIEEFSLIELLSSPSCDYVITKNKDKVSIADIESKVVGFYFYDRRSKEGEVCVAVRSVYDKLKAKGMDFEMVFINRYASGGYPDEESFNKYLEKMPWLAVPFGERTCDKLAYRMSTELDTRCTPLIIKKPGEVCEIFALDMVEEYGFEAYPFTVAKAAELEIEKLSLLSLFNAEGQDFVIQNDNNKTKIKVSKLKSACMVLASNVPSETLSHLKNWYDNVKKVYDDFEVIYVSQCESVTEYDDMLKQMPSAWLALPFGVGRKISSMFKSWRKDDTEIAIFKPDGKYLTTNFLECVAAWELLSNSSYPYQVDIDTVQEMSSHLRSYNMW